MKLTQRQLQHLYWRAGFYLTMPELCTLVEKDKEEIVEDLFIQSRKFKALELDDKFDLPDKQYKMMSDNEKKGVKKLNRQSLKALNNVWLNEMLGTKAILREKMAVFWHDHFACRVGDSEYRLHYLNQLRKHAVGNFREMLFAISKEPAMIGYLNNQQNIKDSPNENFAREVMELFTMGIGNYTEDDIKEAARAFTGWGINREGEFVFRKSNHDYGFKTVLGKTGNFNGDDILTLLLQQKQTAYYITKKIYVYLVSDEPDEEQINQLADQFYQSDYDIEKLLQTIFQSDWFYEEKFIGIKIKSPIDLIISLQKVFSVELTDTNSLIYIQDILGQKLLSPPNVSGWQWGKNWIDTTTLLVRMRLTELLLHNGEIEFLPNDNGDDNDNTKFNYMNNRINSVVDKNELKEHFKGINTKEEMMNYLLQINPKEANAASIDNKNVDELVEQVIAISKMLEFQLC